MPGDAPDTGNRIGILEACSGYDAHYRIGSIDPPLPHRLNESGKAGSTGRLGVHTFFFEQPSLGVKDLLIANGKAESFGSAEQVQRKISVDIMGGRNAGHRRFADH